MITVTIDFSSRTVKITDLVNLIGEENYNTLTETGGVTFKGKQITIGKMTH